eukprot:10537110-Lingulodinium_polyedra.AAC.1
MSSGSRSCIETASGGLLAEFPTDPQTIGAGGCVRLWFCVMLENVFYLAPRRCRPPDPPSARI